LYTTVLYLCFLDVAQNGIMELVVHIYLTAKRRQRFGFPTGCAFMWRWCIV